MTRRSNSEQPQVEAKVFIPEEIEIGIRKLARRIEEVNKLDPDIIPYHDIVVNNTENNIRETIREVFGQYSPEFHDFEYYEIRKGSLYVGMPEKESQMQFADGIPQTVSMLNGLIGRLEEKKLDMGEHPNMQLARSFDNFNFHQRIVDVASERFEKRLYSDAVLNASKVLIHLVQEKSGRYDLDTSKLMSTVFSKNKPILAFSNLDNQTELDEQEGMMHLYMGAILAIRNPRSHSFIEDSPNRALEYIALISMLANRLNDTSNKH